MPQLRPDRLDDRGRQKDGMSHLHIPDGVLPLWLIVAGWVITLALLFISARRLSGPQARARSRSWAWWRR